MNVIIDTHKFVDQLSRDGTFSSAQAERLKDVLSKELGLSTTADLERALLRQTNQFLIAMLAQTALVLAGVQFIVGAA